MFKVLRGISIISLAFIPSYSVLFAQGGEPERIILDFVDAYLIYDFPSKNLQIATERMVLYDGKDWEVCDFGEVKSKGTDLKTPRIYHLRKKDWDQYHWWSVHTAEKKVEIQTSGSFCDPLDMGDRPGKPTDFTVEVVGNPIAPNRFIIRFGQYRAYLIYVPSSNTLQIAAVPKPGGGYVLSDGRDWEICRVRPNIYHFKHKRWDFFWGVDTHRKVAWRTMGGKFCKEVAGKDTLLKMRVRVVK